jgi:hypothetical protein
MVIRTDTSEKHRNPLKDLQGYKEAVTAVLDAADRKDGTLPKQVTIELSDDMVAHLAAAFRATHFARSGNRITIYPQRIARDEFASKPEALLATWYADQGRQPRKLRAESEQRKASLRAGLLALPPHPAREFLLQDVEEGTGWITGLMHRGGVRAALDEATAIIKVLVRLPAPAPIRLKVFASNSLGSSHALDPGKPTYNRVADFLLPEDQHVEFDSRSDARRSILEENNVVPNLTHPKVLLSGRLHLAIGGEPDDRIARNKKRGFATVLTLQEVLASQGVEPLPAAIVTVENEDPFNDLAAVAPPEFLVVFTAGHPSPATRLLLDWPALRAIPRFHWGDVDAGGFRILRILGRETPVSPILMDARAVRANSGHLTPIDEQKRATLEQFLLGASPEETQALQACLQLDGFLEQETIAASAALEAIRGAMTPASPSSRFGPR